MERFLFVTTFAKLFSGVTLSLASLSVMSYFGNVHIYLL